MTKPAFASFTNDDYARLGAQLERGETAILPQAKGSMVADFAVALQRLGKVIGKMPISMETIGDDLHIKRKEVD